MIKYTKPYPTIGQLIKNKNYDYVEYRVHLIYPNSENKSEEDELGEFCGCFKAESGKIIPLDGDCYGYDEEVTISKEWKQKDENGKEITGLTVVVETTME